MGVSGCGKSTIGKRLAKELKLPFYDGDDFHPEANVLKMASGQALHDEDRKEWLENLNHLAKKNRKNGVVIACSALKQVYRDALLKDVSDTLQFVFLEGSYAEILNRIQKRKGHFMPPALLQSQFDALERPLDAITISILHSPEEIVTKIMNTI